MKRYISFVLLTAFLLTGCQKNMESIDHAGSELQGLTWYSSIDAAKQVMSDYRLDEQSEEISSGGQRQTLLDYDDVRLYSQPCDVTLCFTDLGLIGINYHADNDNYAAWTQRLTERFGTPSSEDDTMTIWENPALEGTISVYVFRWEDDVQISFFADDTGSETVPLSELPAETQPAAEQQTESSELWTETAEITETWAAHIVSPEEISAVNGLMFHSDAESARMVMGGAPAAERQMDDQFGNVLELDYENVPLYDKPCDLTLCFTHQGLARIRCFDESGTLEEWVETLKADYGEPSRIEENYVIWENSPLGEHTSIIVDAREEIGCTRVMFNCSCW